MLVDTVVLEDTMSKVVVVTAWPGVPAVVDVAVVLELGAQLSVVGTRLKTIPSQVVEPKAA